MSEGNNQDTIQIDIKSVSETEGNNKDNTSKNAESMDDEPLWKRLFMLGLIVITVVSITPAVVPVSRPGYGDVIRSQQQWLLQLQGR